ncbi:MAG: c-type cytochrome [Nitrospinales bacterium]
MIFRLGFLIISIFLISSGSLFAEEQGGEARNGIPHLQWVVHEGVVHDMPPVLDKKSQGVCPQPRLTKRAPDPFYNLKNPLAPTEGNILAGETLFKVDAKPIACKVCHGVSGNGFGIIYKVQGFSPQPRNFTCYQTMKDLPDGQLFWVIKNGSKGTRMPSFDFYLSDDQIWQVILFLRKFARE